MGIPEGMDLDPKKYVLKLRWSLYGLKQAPRIWWDRMTLFLLKAGFYQCDAELAIFIRSLDNKFLILLLFIDDILLTGDQDVIEEFIKECCNEFKTQDIGTPRRFLGIHIEHWNGKVILHQKAYIQRILERFNAPMNPVATLLDPKHPLIKKLGIKYAAALKRVLRLATTSYEVIWLWKLILAILSQYVEHTMPSNIIYCDNQGAIATANQPSHSPSTRSKHIDICFHVIREAIANGLIRLEYICTTEMTADILTKALPKELHKRHVKGMGMKSI
ncbi:hypothetical protein TSTA_080820 [Talaromyces stipitatus ATCC 10500]|uniref:Reverse transcriptase Ty1/copia-type domain-containing protein n=1 Tax=Talaromyces stipitatus (strain ATCC 10500 / CBS 375.48 / QM 6759 / NRRL 1006) TaxID=441959 RepID=B8LZR7_TALSN|nr:uncharacterized protein TSTA_080820 [Talaromyces stipitatus ATCC 10500]EED20849.1 hypothetical protein TSTA_080820 [Talaromyces stipitatus ATCC 10500]